MYEKGLKERLKKRVLSNMDLSVEQSDEEIGRIIDRCILEESGESYLPLKEKIQLRKELFNSFRRLDILTELLEDSSISEIMVNGHDNIFVERNGSIERVEKSFESEDQLKAIAQQIVADCNRRINEADPIVDARLSDGSRVNIVFNPVSLSGPVVTIRKFPEQKINMEKLIEMGSLTREAAALLELLVKAGYNIFISGGTGSGKTTFLNALSDYIPNDERIITIEDAAELSLHGIKNLVRLEARNANVEGENAISIRDLIRTSLRMRPDRIIVGEVRDKAALDMLSAMNTGHDGSLSTGHANSPQDMISRLETMVLMGMDLPVAAIRKQIASGLDLIIHLGRIRDGSRKVLMISEVMGMEEGEVKLNTLFEFVETGETKGKIIGTLKKVSELFYTQKLMNAGLMEFYREVCVE